MSIEHVDLSFDKKAVQDYAKVFPWDRQEQFSAEIDADDMATTAAVYARAAAEGATAETLAERADQVAAEAGDLDGSSLVDADHRIRDTQKNLRPDELEGVPSLLVLAMNTALEAEEEVFRMVLGDGGLDVARSRHEREARIEYHDWAAAVDRALWSIPVDFDEPPPAVPVTLPRHGTRMIHPVVGPDGRAFFSVLPWAPEIREKHLRNAADDAVEVAGEIEGVIGRYRRRLMEIADELARREHEVGSGPLADLWLSPHMARYAAEELEALLTGNGEASGTEALEHLTGVKIVLEGIYGAGYADEGTPRAGRHLTEAERAYLEEFYSAFSDIGAVAAADWPRREAGEQVMGLVADGFFTLTNPQVGGISPSEAPHTLASVFNVSVASPEPYSREDIQRARDIASVLPHASVAPGRALAEELARYAVDLEYNSTYEWDTYTGKDLGESPHQLLEVAGRHPGAVTTLMGDPEFTRSLVHGFYLLSEDGELEPAVSEVVRRATTLPEGASPSGPEGRALAEAAETYLSLVDSDPFTAALAQEDAALVRELATAWGAIDPGRFGRFADLKDFTAA